LPTMVGGIAHREAAGPIPMAIDARAQDLIAGKYPGMFVRVRGTLGDTTRANGATTLTVSSPPHNLTAYLFDWPAHRPLPAVSRGSLADVPGVPAVLYNPDGTANSLLLTMPDVAALAVVQPPIFWTPFRIITAAVAGALLAIAVIAWVWILNA